MLGDHTLVDSRMGRKLNNALTFTYRTGPGEPLAVVTQAKGMGVLLGFKNGGASKYTLETADAQYPIDCAVKASTLTGPDGALIGTVMPDGAGNALLADASGALLATLHGHPYDRRHEPYWPHALTDAAGEPLGTFTVIRASSNIDWLGDVIDVTIWWGRPGGPLKVPTIGVTLQLDHPVGDVLGDVLMLAMIDSAGATRDHLVK